MFGPQHIKKVIKFLDGVDHALSQRMIRKFPPDEPALTNELCALLDADTQNAEGRLSYSLDQLNLDLAAAGDGLDFDVTLDTYPHNSAMERHVSQSDFGLVLTYDNRVLPEENWSTAYLVQAKRLFRNPNSSEYDDRASFQALNAEQQVRIKRLSEILGETALRYCLYCPPTPALSAVQKVQVRALHTRNLARDIFDYERRLALRDILSTTDGIDAGVWLRSVKKVPNGLLALHDEAFRSALPFTWFVIQHFSRHSRRELNDFHRSDDRVKRIVTGDQQAIRDLIAELAQAGEEHDAPANITVLPRHTISIQVTVGKSLPPDFARAQLNI